MSSSPSPPRILIIGAGSRGIIYAGAITSSTTTPAVVAAVAEPIPHKRRSLGRKHVWGDGLPSEGQEFESWTDFFAYEVARRERTARGDVGVPPGVDAVFVCVRDELHREIVVGLAPLKLHIMCEKPLATSLQDCLSMYRALLPDGSESADAQEVVFSIGHVLRYTPHNMLLRKLLLEDKVIGDVTSVVHTEPIGWWHFTHSYVRGNWRNSKTTGPSLLTKSCHDIDLLLWLLCSPVTPGKDAIPAHLPSTVSSTGGLNFFRKARKPAAAGDATNCLSCPLGDDVRKCRYSARNIYTRGKGWHSLAGGNVEWPVNVVVPEIEDIAPPQREAALDAALGEDYDAATAAASPESVSSRNWFGRCVFESDNDVCDEQTVTLTWAEDPAIPTHHTKTAVFHMVAQTEAICRRRSHFYGTEGELAADSNTITVTDFLSGETRTYTPGFDGQGGWKFDNGGGHGGGDRGLTLRFVAAVDAVKNRGWSVRRAQDEMVGCTLEEAVRSHCAVFAAEEARVKGQTVRWDDWWAREVGEGKQQKQEEPAASPIVEKGRL